MPKSIKRGLRQYLPFKDRGFSPSHRILAPSPRRSFSISRQGTTHTTAQGCRFNTTERDVRGIVGQEGLARLRKPDLLFLLLRHKAMHRFRKDPQKGRPYPVNKEWRIRTHPCHFRCFATCHNFARRFHSNNTDRLFSLPFLWHKHSRATRFSIHIQRCLPG